MMNLSNLKQIDLNKVFSLNSTNRKVILATVG